MLIRHFLIFSVLISVAFLLQSCASGSSASQSLSFKELEKSHQILSLHNFPITFSEAPLVTATVTNNDISGDDTVKVYSVSKTGVTLGLRNGRTANFIAMRKWR